MSGDTRETPYLLEVDNYFFFWSTQVTLYNIKVMPKKKVPPSIRGVGLLTESGAWGGSRVPGTGRSGMDLPGTQYKIDPDQFVTSLAATSQK